MFRDIRALLKARKNPKAAAILATRMLKDEARSQFDGAITKFNLVFFALIGLAVLFAILGIYLGIHLGSAFYFLTLIAAFNGWLLNKVRISVKTKVLAAKATVMQIAAGLSRPAKEEALETQGDTAA